MPTLKQKLTVSKIMENNGNVSKAMKEAGYAISTSTNPQQVTNSKGWKELMEEHLPDSLLAEKHRQLLDKKEVIVKNNNKTGEIEVIPTGEIDSTSVGKALDMAYKLKGKNAPEKQIVTTIDSETLDEDLLLAKQIRELRERTTRHIEGKGTDSEPVGREAQD